MLAGDAPTCPCRCCRPNCFNPRPPLLAGDAWLQKQAAYPYTFQSAPAIAGGRCLSHSCNARSRWCFNPRPPLLAGDAATRRETRSSSVCFNPRPPLLAGDADLTFIERHLDPVSIRARHCWRAMPPGPGWRGWPSSCFNPRPPLLAGDAPVAQPLDLSDAVSIRARHCWRAMLFYRSFSCRTFCFNPRPPLLAGDAGMQRIEMGSIIVSIRARHCWRAMRRRDGQGHAGQPVSIRARHCWRAMPNRLAGCGCSGRFQSAPAIAGGRCHPTPPIRPTEGCFNPRPPLLAGDAA